MKMRFALGSYVMTGLVAAAAMIGCSKKEAEPNAGMEDNAATMEVPQLTASMNAPTPPAPKMIDPSAVLVEVNGQSITKAELDKEVEMLAGRFGQQVPPAQRAVFQQRLEQQALEGLITKTLLLERIEQENVDVTDEELDEALADITKNLPAGISLEDVALRNNTSVEQIKTDLSLDLKVSKLVEGSLGKVAEPSDEEVASFYEENKHRFDVPENVTASHILITVEESDDEATRAEKRERAEKVRQMLLDGADFAETAKEHSEGPSNVAGGNLGRFTRGQMVPSFEEAAFTQEVGEIGDIVETRFGYHIIKVEEHEEGGVMPLDDEAKENISNMLTAQQRQANIQQYITDLRSNATIQPTESLQN